MNPQFYIDTYRRYSNLYIGLTGKFDQMCAWALLKTIMRQKVGFGRIFVNTRGLKEVEAKGAALFKDHMHRENLPKDWLYFKGPKGFELAPDGARVLICCKDPSRRKRPNPMLRNALAARTVSAANSVHF